MIDIIVMLLFAAGVAAYMFPKFIKMYSTSKDKDFAERILLIIGIATTAFVFIFSAINASRCIVEMMQR